MKPTTSIGHATSAPAVKNRDGRKRHGYRPHRANDRRGSGTSTLAGSERTARNRVRNELRVVQLLARSA
ncbi:hypothetical protein O3Q52_10670 [Streptomyces sp. ActVer]|uniref:hypothetical protein n=1 Tax=Streptomyces sp. ActVer TaxID=3014558 RepID=UPI0022B596AA|nr:hypothetical protein [Streptomyces sp. ActVer]MCZ4508661.1 hypothetical protein [Streptomyces sp. ActVer]